MVEAVGFHLYPDLQRKTSPHSIDKIMKKNFKTITFKFKQRSQAKWQSHSKIQRSYFIRLTLFYLTGMLSIPYTFSVLFLENLRP